MAQCGVITSAFANAVAAKGLFYPPDPGSQAASTLGGNVAENAGGLRGLKYGVTKDYVMGVNFFSTEGEFIKSGSKTVKCVTGLNVSQLMVGSEGTIGVMSDIIFKLVPPPRASKAMMAVYDDIMAASRTVAAIIANKVIPCTLELMDNFTINAVEGFAKVGLPTDAQALLLIEVDGHPAPGGGRGRHGGAHLQGERLHQAASGQGRRRALQGVGGPPGRPVVPGQAASHHRAGGRHRAALQDPGHDGGPEQDRRPVQADHRHLRPRRPTATSTPTILCDRRDKEEFHRVELAVDEIFDAALALDGTLSGEHGIGIAKSKYLEKETNKASVLFSKRIKLANDPKNLLNPSKILGE